jgi:hypothetical protein
VQNDIKALLIKGRFTEQDWAELVGTLRRINDRHPEETYWASILDSEIDPTSTEVVDFLKRTYPTRPGHELDIFLKRRKH